MRKFEIKNDKYVISVEITEKWNEISEKEKNVKVHIATASEGLLPDDFNSLAQDLYDLRGVIR